jgi:aromatic-amino-acid transaminase
MEKEMISLVASTSFGKGKEDASFSAAGDAKKAIRAFGKEEIIDATLGVIKDETAEFASLETVRNIFDHLPSKVMMDYAPIEGVKEYLDAATRYVFNDLLNADCYSKAVATIGGSGAIHHMIKNYVEVGEAFLIPEWHWGPYREMAHEINREWIKYPLFVDNAFSLEPLKNHIDEVLKSQNSLMLIVNSPAHNPSGYSFTKADWSELIDYLNVYSETKKIILLADIAYIDYADEPDRAREFMACFNEISEKMLVAVAFSMSKSFLMYGMRSGALIGVAKDKAIVDEFFNVSKFSNRATWSNGVRGAQQLLVEIMNDKELYAEVLREREALRSKLNKRAEIFLEEAQQVGLQILPYRAGFFMTVPCDNPVKLSKKLTEDKIFSIPLADGVRFAISSVQTDKIPGMARTINRALFSI